MGRRTVGDQLALPGLEPGKRTKPAKVWVEAEKAVDRMQRLEARRRKLVGKKRHQMELFPTE